MSTSSDANPRRELFRFRSIATAALARYDLGRPSFALVKHGENVTYRVRSQGDGDLLLRIHRPIYHTAREVASELEWLRVLAGSEGLRVPEPVPNTDGNWLTIVDGTGMEPAHVCTLLRWVSGRRHWDAPTSTQLEALGATMARLHLQARSWRPSAGFTRPALDRESLLGERSNWGHVPGGLEAFFQEADWPVVREALQRIRTAMDRLDASGEGRTLIHADLHLGNVIFARGEACPIDFDDSGFGYSAYDLATTLFPFHGTPRWQQVRDALLEGYSSVAAFSALHLETLQEFLVTRGLTMTLWLASRAPLIPRLGRILESSVPRVAAMCRTLTQA